MINWTKLGLIVKPKDYNLSWWKTFGMDPCSIHLKKSIYRIFFCGRNIKNISQIGYVDYDLDKLKVLNISKKPVLTPGSLGCFDDKWSYSFLRNKERLKFIFILHWLEA